MNFAFSVYDFSYMNIVNDIQWNHLIESATRAWQWQKLFNINLKIISSKRLQYWGFTIISLGKLMKWMGSESRWDPLGYLCMNSSEIFWVEKQWGRYHYSGCSVLHPILITVRISNRSDCYAKNVSSNCRYSVRMRERRAYKCTMQKQNQHHRNRNPLRWPKKHYSQPKQHDSSTFNAVNFTVISGVTIAFLILNSSLAIFLRICGRNQCRGAIWEIAPHLAWLFQIKQIFLQLFFKGTVSPR